MTSGPAIPDDIRRFILTSIPSVPYLEAMLLLRNETQRPWDGKTLAQRLYMSEKAAAQLLAELHEAPIAQIVEPHSATTPSELASQSALYWFFHLVQGGQSQPPI